MQTRSGKVLIARDATRKRKRDEIKSTKKKQKTEIVGSACNSTWGTLPTIIIGKIFSHLKEKNPEASFVNLENQLSANQHWRKAVQNEACRTHLTLDKIKTKAEVTSFLNTLEETGIRNLKHLRLHNQHNQISHINKSLESNPFQLETLTISSKRLTSKLKECQRTQLSEFVGNNSSPGHGQNPKVFTAKRINLSVEDLSIFLGITTITTLHLQIPAPMHHEPVMFFEFQRIRSYINVQKLVNLKDVDIEYTSTEWDRKWHSDRIVTPCINCSGLSSNIESIRLKGACLINSQNQPLQPLTKLKFLSLETDGWRNFIPFGDTMMRFLVSKWCQELTYIYINKLLNSFDENF